VVAASYMPDLAERDLQLLRSRAWRLQQVHFRGRGTVGKMRSLGLQAHSRLARTFFFGLKTPRLAARACCPLIRELLTKAISEPADWFIAHTQPALPIAAAAAQHWGAQLGFDCEDLLTGRDGNSLENQITRVLERTHLSRCHYVSVPSPGIGSALQQQNRIPTPTVLYNVFPLHLADGMLSPKDRTSSSRLRLHWVGQTIGPGKGIEDAFAAAAHLGDVAELHIRGMVANGYESLLRDLERHYGVKAKFHPVVHHDELVRTMDQFDVGLALERPEDGMYSVTVTNKFFLYLLAGLAIAATDTIGQRHVMHQIPEAGFLYPAGNPELLAEKLHAWAVHRSQLLAAQQAAWDAARNRFCWDKEQSKFLQLLNGTESSEAQLAVARSG
jgi:glycosyltransferase involved in cell wall biosynthesis